MYSKIISGGVLGVEGLLIQVETDINQGLPMFNMVGYLSSCVKESGERVRTALKNSGFNLPPRRITINLSPADIRKEGTAYDLPIAIGILVSMGIIPEEKVENTIIIGELSLNGHVNHVTGVLPIIHHAKKQGIGKCIVPQDNAKEAAIVPGIEVIPVSTLFETEQYLNGISGIEPVNMKVMDILSENRVSEVGDFSEIKGQEILKRGMEIAAAGMHNILMTGPAGSGKSMIAKRLPTILPKITYDESIEITKIYSVAGLLKKDQSLITERPFRSPHHTVSAVAMAGGGVVPKPGEISLSHNGVLFLDELPEFNKSVLEVMRQPLEDREVCISRINANYIFPAGFMLVAARNSCPCGAYPDMNKCTCTMKQIRQYNSKISRPRLDRIDINVDVKKVSSKELLCETEAESSAVIRQRVYAAQNIQKERYKNEEINFNSQLNGSLSQKYIKLKRQEKDFMESVFKTSDLSARGFNRVLKIARTIADLAGDTDISEKHLKEAVYFRNSDAKEGVL